MSSSDYESDYMYDSPDDKDVPIKEDRLSSLPESVLIRILSFLPLRTAIQASRLARKWRYLWRSIDSLDFNLNKLEEVFFPLKDVGLYCKINKMRRRNRFQDMEKMMINKVIQFVDRLLLIHSGSGIKKFHLSYSQWKTHVVDGLISSVELWIQSAISHNVQELDIRLHLSRIVRLPPCLFTSDCLEVLHLALDKDLIIPRTIGFSRLRIMHLSSLVFCDENMTRLLFSSSPVLENLCIIGCEAKKEMKVLEISSLSLRCLVIESGQFGDSTVKVNAPRLESFKYHGCLAQGYVLEHFSCLLEASFECTTSDNYGVEPLCDVLDGFSKVNILKICKSCIKAFWQPSKSLYLSAPSPHLRYLEMGLDLNVESLQVMMKLIKTNPNLRTLVIYLDKSCSKFKKNDSEEFMGVLRSSSEAMMDNLRRVEMRETCDLELQLQLVKYFLQTQQLLEKMKIECRYAVWNSREKVAKQIFGLPRASPKLSLLLK